MTSALLRIRKKIIGAASRLISVLGRRTLSRQETLAFLGGAGALDEGLISLSPTVQSIELLKYGVVRINRRDCLDLDYGASSAAAGWLGRRSRHENVLVLWSHKWMGYYHWLIDVAPKIVRYRDQVRMGEVILAYPRSDAPYENEVLELLGLSGDTVVDTREFRSIRVHNLYFDMLPGWFLIQPAVIPFREILLEKVSNRSGSKKIYLTRSGRRRCINEEQVVSFLSERGFVTIEDVQRSVAEQIEIFSSASVIVALHGAALANLLWCAPGTHVIECFPASYRPPYYKNLSILLGLDYQACPEISGNADGWENVNENIEIDLQELDVMMRKIEINP